MPAPCSLQGEGGGYIELAHTPGEENGMVLALHGNICNPTRDLRLPLSNPHLYRTVRR